MTGKNLNWDSERKRIRQKTDSLSGHASRTYYNEATEKQRKYATDMVAICNRCGIDLSFARPRFNTMDQCRKVIRTAYTMLEKNGYDCRGNKIGE